MLFSHRREIFRFNPFEILTRFSSSFLVLFLPKEEKHWILTNPWNTKRSFERFSNNIFLSGEWTPIIMLFSLFSRPLSSFDIWSTSVDLTHLSLPVSWLGNDSDCLNWPWALLNILKYFSFLLSKLITLACQSKPLESVFRHDSLESLSCFKLQHVVRKNISILIYKISNYMPKLSLLLRKK